MILVEKPQLIKKKKENNNVNQHSEIKWRLNKIWQGAQWMEGGTQKDGKQKQKKKQNIYFFNSIFLAFFAFSSNPLLIFTLEPLFYHSVADWECVLCFIIILFFLFFFISFIYFSIPFHCLFWFCCCKWLRFAISFIYLNFFVRSLFFLQRGLWLP